MISCVMSSKVVDEMFYDAPIIPLLKPLDSTTMLEYVRRCISDLGLICVGSQRYLMMYGTYIALSGRSKAHVLIKWLDISDVCVSTYQCRNFLREVTKNVPSISVEKFECLVK